MLFKHIKGHKKIPMARVVPTQARREPDFDSGGFPEPGFRVRGEEGAEKKKTAFPTERHTSQSSGGNRVSGTGS